MPGTVVRYIVETETIPGYVEVAYEPNAFERFGNEAIKEGVYVLEGETRVKWNRIVRTKDFHLKGWRPLRSER